MKTENKEGCLLLSCITKKNIKAINTKISEIVDKILHLIMVVDLGCKFIKYIIFQREAYENNVQELF